MKKQMNLVVVFFCFCLILLSCKKEEVFIKRKPQLTVNGTDKRFNNSAIRFVKDTVYNITSGIIIKRGQTFIIEKGTLLKINRTVSIVIQAGGKIEAQGTSDAPVVFTSSANKGEQGSERSNIINNWGALEIEGEPGFNSGGLSYVRIEFAGNAVAGGLLLKNVDSSTILNHIQVSFTAANKPGFLFTRGNCNAKYLYGFCNKGHDFEFNNSYNGKLQFIAAHRHPLVPFFPKSSGTSGDFNLSGILVSGAGTLPVISNATIIGPDTQNGVSNNTFYTDTINGSTFLLRAGIIIDENASFHMRNISVYGFPQAGFFLNSREGAIGITTGRSSLTFSVLHANYNNRVFYMPPVLFPGISAAQVKDFLLQPQFSNRVVEQVNELYISRPFDYYNPDLLPTARSPLLNGADFNTPFFEDVFFEKVSYIGAFGNNNWLNGWANFIPLQTNYNN